MPDPTNPQQRQSQPGAVASTTRSLILGLKEFDDDAWDRLVRLYTPLVYHWCRKQGLGADDIPDVVQEVFQSVSAHIDRFRKERSRDTFRGWLHVITRNKAIDHLRRQQKEARGEGGTVALERLAAIPAPPDAEERGDGELIADGGDDREARSILFQRAFELIRNDFRETTWQAFWLVVVGGRPPSDVADELGMSPGAVRVAKCRVLQRLRLELGELEPDVIGGP